MSLKGWLGVVGGWLLSLVAAVVAGFLWHANIKQKQGMKKYARAIADSERQLRPLMSAKEIDAIYKKQRKRILEDNKRLHAKEVKAQFEKAFGRNNG